MDIVLSTNIWISSTNTNTINDKSYMREKVSQFSQFFNETQKFSQQMFWTLPSFNTFNTDEAKTMKLFPAFEWNPVNLESFFCSTFVVYCMNINLYVNINILVLDKNLNMDINLRILCKYPK